MRAFRKVGDGWVPKEEAWGNIEQREGRFPGLSEAMGEWEGQGLLCSMEGRRPLEKMWDETEHLQDFVKETNV